MNEEEWKTQLGWQADRELPFNASDTTIQKDLVVGFDDIKGSLESHIGKGRNYFVFLYGPVGAGKTTMLNWVEKEEAGKGRSVVIKFSSPPTRNEVVEHINYLFQPESNFFSRILGIFTTQHKLPKTIHALPEFLTKISNGRKIVFLVDEIEKIQFDEQLKEGLNDLKNVMEATKSITILAGLPEAEKHLTESMKSRIQHKVMMRKMAEKEVAELIEKRIVSMGSINKKLFTDDAVGAVYTQSGGAPRYAIKLCDKAIRYAIRDGRFEINVGDVITAHEELGKEEGVRKPETAKEKITKGEPEEGKPTLKEEVQRESFVGKLPKAEVEILKLLGRKPGLTVDEIAGELKITNGTVYNQIAALQGKKRRKEGVPYPLLATADKEGKIAYSLKDHVGRYFAGS